MENSVKISLEFRSANDYPPNYSGWCIGINHSQGFRMALYQVYYKKKFNTFVDMYGERVEITHWTDTIEDSDL